MSYIADTLGNLVHQTAFFNLTVGNYVMIAVACVIICSFSYVTIYGFYDSAQFSDNGAFLNLGAIRYQITTAPSNYLEHTACASHLLTQTVRFQFRHSDEHYLSINNNFP